MVSLPPQQFTSALKASTTAAPLFNRQLHLDAANNVQKFFMNFVVLDMLIVGALYQRIWMASSTSLQTVAACATLTFIFDIILAVAVLWFFCGHESHMDGIDDRWWESHAGRILANVASNSCSLLALSTYQIMCSGGRTTLLILSYGCIIIQAAKYRPIFLLHKQLAFALKHDDNDPSRYSKLLDYWAVDKKWHVKVVLVSIATIVAGLAAAACWDAMPGNNMHGNYTAVSGNEHPLSHATPWTGRGTGVPVEESSLALTAMDSQLRKPVPLHLSTQTAGAIVDGVADMPGGMAYGSVQDFSPSGNDYSLARDNLSWWNATTPTGTSPAVGAAYSASPISFLKPRPGPIDGVSGITQAVLAGQEIPEASLPLLATNAQSQKPVPLDLPKPLFLSTCACKNGMLGAASNGATVGAAAGAGGSIVAGPEATPLGGSIGGAVGMFGGLACYMWNC